MAKIRLDKYYTPSDLAGYCVKKTKEVIGVKNISEWLEPSAGGGAFLPFLDNNYKAYDIEPEHDAVIKQDYLELEITYLKGRCIIGNPPFGRRNNLIVKFYKKAIKQADYIAFILPVSQFENNIRMYEFDMVYSEKLPETSYSGKVLKCCFNIYKKPKHRMNIKPDYSLKDIEISEHHSTRNIINFNNDVHDFRMCAWGASMGKEVFYQKYALEYCIKITNQKLKETVLELLRNTNWKSNISTPNLCKWQVYKYLKEKIPELQ